MRKATHPIRHRLRTGAAVAMLGATACGAASTATTPTPAPATTTDIFSGEINQLGSTGHPFAVTATGTVEIRLTSVGPLDTMALGVALTSSDGTNCSTTIVKNDNSRSAGNALEGTAAAGNYCVRVYDSGNVPQASTATYTVQAVHP